MKMLQLRDLRVAYPLTKIDKATGRATAMRSSAPEHVLSEIGRAWARAHKSRYATPIGTAQKICWTDDVGITLVDEPPQPLKVDESFVYPKQKSPYTRKQFEVMRRDGVIVVTPDVRGEIRTRDTVFISNPTLVGNSEYSVGNSSLLANYGENYAGPRPDVWSDSAPWDSTSLHWPGSIFRPNQSVSSGIKARYVTLSGTSTTLLTQARRVVSETHQCIRNTFESASAPIGLVTSGVSELNDSLYDLLTEMAELPETVQMIYASLRKALLFYKECRRGELAIRRKYKDKPPQNALEEIASIWLAYRYGIQPIAYSVKDALDYLDASGVLYRTVRKREDQAPSLSDLPDGVSLLTMPNLQVRYFGKGRLSAATTQGLGLNPLTTAWELVPLSFVVDWFLNVGDLLGALAPSAQFDQTVHTDSVKWQQDLRFLYQEQIFTASVDLYQRRVIHSPLARIGLSFDPFINLKRSLDAMSLSWLAFLTEWRKRS